jgi:hypothetical protein
MAEIIFMKLCVYVVEPKPISKTYFINPCHQAVCLYVYPPLVAGQQLSKNSLIVARKRLGKNVTVATNTHATIE